MSESAWFDAVAHRDWLAEYPIGPAFVETFTRLSRDELRAAQERRFRAVMDRAWRVPFYRRRWEAAGLAPGDVRTLDDSAKLPRYSKADLMESVAAHPPFGDYHGVDSYPPAARPPVVLHTTSGTTGRPQPILWGPKGREMQNLMLARAYRLQGLRDDDVVHSVYGHGLVNGGHYVRETVMHFTRALFVSAGTGLETRSRTQVELMRDLGATVIVGFADYVRHLADVAREAGLVPDRDLRIRMISGHLGRESRAALSDAWGGAEVFDWYGVADTGTVAAEGPDHAGLYLMEDAHWVELLDPETGAPVDDGMPGNLCVTSLFKDDVFPVVRFDTQDLAALVPGASPLGLGLRRIGGILGRSDNMVKLRGINVYPTAVGETLREAPATTGEFLCRLDRVDEREELTVLVEVRAARSEWPALSASLRDLLRRRLGVDLPVEAVAPGSLAPLTGIESRQKPVRLLDNRRH
ncbi:MAG: AMP-binding protein [Candidatus Rokubacteria bacterium]|nr:AMP-binding protein [Candidatus Rokubacteria bacterium]